MISYRKKTIVWLQKQIYSNPNSFIRAGNLSSLLGKNIKLLRGEENIRAAEKNIKLKKE